MSADHDQERAASFGLPTVALIVVASTITADIANFDGRPGLSRVLWFGLSGLASAAALLVPMIQKKTQL
jgi:hypothetical protein